MEDNKEIIFKVTRSLKKKPNKEHCYHRRVVVDEKFRTVECSDCGGVVEPFEFILRWANEETRFEMEVEYLKRELRKLHDEKHELRKEISYIKRKKSTTGTRPIIQPPQFPEPRPT